MNLDDVKDLRVLMVGDAIIDEYVYVTPIGKSIKEPVISTRFERKESFRGGIWAAAAHLTDLCAKVDIITGDSVMVNTRYVDQSGMRKLFTLHEGRSMVRIRNDTPIGEYDLVIVIDFGHGALTYDFIESLMREAKFLAVNAQTNSQNFGFNVITKYDADFVVLDELEARLAMHDNVSPIEKVIEQLGFSQVIVTRGMLGALGYDDGEFHAELAQARNVVDTMGAGDAVLAVSSVFAAVGWPMCDLVRVGNAAGAVKVGILGHQQSVTRAALEAQLAL